MSEIKGADYVEDKNGKILKVGDTVVFNNGKKARIIWSEEHDRAYFDFDGNLFEVIFYSYLHEFEILE